MDKKDSGLVNRREILDSLSHKDSKRRGFLKGVFSTFIAVTGFSSSSTAEGINRDELLTAARTYYSEEAIRDEIREHADGLLDELAKRGYLDQPAVNELPVGSLLSAEAYANAAEGAMVFAIQSDERPAPRIELTKRLSKKQKLIIVVRPEEERAYAIVKPTDQAPTFGDAAGETITTQDDDCPGCYDIDCSCYVGCSPYDNCTCYTVCQTNCDCCYTDGSCYGCDDEYSC